MLDFTGSYSSLRLTRMLVFIILAVVGLAYLAVSAVIGHHGDVDGDSDHSGPSFLSIRSIAIFLTSFGTVGALSRWCDQTAVMSSFWGVVAGFVMICVYVFAMGAVHSQQADSLIRNEELVGLTARVTIPIPDGGMGEISCNTRAQTARRMARAKDGGTISEGSIVKISTVQGDMVLVEPVGSK